MLHGRPASSASADHPLTPRLNDQPPKKGIGKKPAPAPGGASKQAKVVKNPLFESRPKNFGIGAFSVIFSPSLFAHMK